MIIDLDMTDRTVVVVGGGAQAERRVAALLQEGCRRIVVLSASASDAIRKWSADGAITLEERDVADGSFLDRHGPSVVVAATDDPKVNGMAVSAARSRGILGYRSDDSALSDFSHPSVMRIEGGITVAVSTGGRSPAVSKQICRKAESVLRGVITPREVAHMRIQDAVRRAAKTVIKTQAERRRLLEAVMADRTVDRLIRDGRLGEAEERAMSMLRGDKKT